MYYHISTPALIHRFSVMLPVPTPPKRDHLFSEENSNSEKDDVSDPDYRGAVEKRNPYNPNLKELNSLIENPGLTKYNAGLS